MSPKIRKKDMCPCGSGKRYKNCCFTKKRSKNSSHIDKPATNAKEILQPDDIRKIGQLFKDLHTEEAFEKYPGLRWSRAKVAKMSTKEIIEKLQSMNVHFDEREFKEQAQSYLSAVHLAEDHYYTQDWRGSIDEDFIWLAIIELWNQLLPEQINIEMADDAMHNGYKDREDGDYKSALQEWQALWDMLKEIIPPDITSVEKADAFVDSLPHSSLSHYLFNWCQDFEEALHVEAVTDESYFNKRITFVTEFCQKFPDTDDVLIQEMLKAEAESYAFLGDTKKAESLFEVLAKRFPDNALIYIWWGDIYLIMTPPQCDKAEKVYRLGLRSCTTEREKIYHQLKELKEEYSCP